MSTVSVSSARATKIDTSGTPNNRITVTFLDGLRSSSTVYYKSSSDVSASSNDGSLSPTGSLTLDGVAKWFIAATASDGSLGSVTLDATAPAEEDFAGELFRKSPTTSTFQVSADHGATWTDVSGTGPAGAPGATGPQGNPGTAPYTSVEQLSATPGTVTDWGPLIQTAITNGATHFQFGERDYPFQTPIDVHGKSSMIYFEGARGRGWYPNDANDRRGSRLIWKGGASPVVTVLDAAITAGQKVLTSASGPWTLDSILHVGQPITVVGAGPAGADLVTAIVSRQSATQVTLLDAASTTVSTATASFTNWTRAIQGQSSTGLSFVNMKLVYDNTAFDGILLDLRRDSTTWSARGLLRDCHVYGDLGAQDAYCLLHLSGHGEMFEAHGVNFALARACVRGQYQMNTDDAHFEDCNFDGYWEGAVVNPGRFWKFTNPRFTGGNAAGTAASPLRGPALTHDRIGLMGTNINPVLVLDQPRFWDRTTKTLADGAITSGTTTLTSASAPFAGKSWYWEGRNIFVAGAGAAGGFLNTRIDKWISTTQVTLRDAASTTVTAASVSIGDGGLIYTKSGSNPWTIYARNLMTWLGSSTELEMKGPGLLSIDHWWTNRAVRPDLIGDGPLIDLGNYATDLKSVWLDDIRPNDPVGNQEGQELAIVNLDGHDLQSVKHVKYARAFETIGLMQQESVEAWVSKSATPAVAVSAGQAAGITAGASGTDMIGHITVTTGASGANAGKLVDITFAKAWRSLSNSFANSEMGNLELQLTPQEPASTPGSGAAAAAAGVYYVTGNANPLTGWTLGIANAVTGAKTLRWSYRIVRS